MDVHQFTMGQREELIEDLLALKDVEVTVVDFVDSTKDAEVVEEGDFV